MSEKQWLEDNKRAIDRLPKIGPILAGLAVVGLIAFIVLMVVNRQRAWQAYWVNFLFWMGLAQAGVVLSALVHLTRGRWGGTIVRLGLLQVAFLPVCLVLFIGIMIGSAQLVPWVAEPLPEKGWWLNLPSFLIRNLLGMLTICAASLAFAYYTLRPEAGAARDQSLVTYPEWLTRNWQGVEVERARSQRILSWLAPLLIFVYCIVYSLIGFDMVMSLDPHWYSTLFGAYYFITTMYMGLAAIIVLAAVFRPRLGLQDALNPDQFHDTGKLLLGFCLLSADFLWSQYLVIWYGDLPEEISFIEHRVLHDPWYTISLLVLFGGFVIPFIILLNRRIKRIPATLALVGGVILFVGFGERLLMVIPSLHMHQPEYTLPVGPAEILISLGFAGLYLLSFLWAARRAPIVPGPAKVPVE